MPHKSGESNHKDEGNHKGCPYYKKRNQEKETGHILADVPGCLPTASSTRFSCLEPSLPPFGGCPPHGFPGRPWEPHLLDRLPQ